MNESIVWIDILTATPPQSGRYLITTSSGKREIDILFYSIFSGWLNADTYRSVGISYVLAWAHLPAKWDTQKSNFNNKGD